MINFLTTLHIIITVVLCALVLVQDSKGGGALGIGGSGSNSLLGATGAQTLASKMTRWTAVLFAVSCVALTWALARQNKSVIDQLPVSAPVTAPATTPVNGAAATTPATEPAKETAKTETTSAPQQTAPAEKAANPVEAPKADSTKK